MMAFIHSQSDGGHFRFSDTELCGFPISQTLNSADSIMAVFMPLATGQPVTQLAASAAPARVNAVVPETPATVLIASPPALPSPAREVSDGSTGSLMIVLIVTLVVLVPLGMVAVVYGVVPISRALAWLFRHTGQFLRFALTDIVRLLGHAVTAVAFSALVVFNSVAKREVAAEYYAQAFASEAKAAGLCLYRVVLGHPLRLFYLHGILEGVERRLPHVVNREPGFGDDNAAQQASRGVVTPGPEPAQTGEPVGMTGQTVAGPNAATAAAPQIRRKYTPAFDGYAILGTLAGGGSGGRLYVARPTGEKAIELIKDGYADSAGTVGDVVIKSFSIREGSSLPQIIRESRSLEAAHRLGLILEHQLSGERFFYVMRYVPGNSLSLVTHELHAKSPAAGVGTPGGLGHEQLKRAVEHVCDLMATLRVYHEAGLWHKDIKPDNIIVHAVDSRAHLVDFGLLTPLRSSMTLTTHGTEYFRDPEMVRMALRGTKVKDVDGCKFDIYGAGAVMYAVLENSFPAHGALSAISKRCPSTLKWVVRRAMTDYDKRYPTSAAMLADLEVVYRALQSGPEAVERLRPADLPSVKLAERQEALEAGEEVGPPLDITVNYTAPQPLAGMFAGKRADGQLADRLEPDMLALGMDGEVDLRLVPGFGENGDEAGALGKPRVEEFVPTSESRKVAAGDQGVTVDANEQTDQPRAVLLEVPDTFDVTMQQTASVPGKATVKALSAAPPQTRTPLVKLDSPTAGPSAAGPIGGPTKGSGKRKRSPAATTAIVVFAVVVLWFANLWSGPSNASRQRTGAGNTNVAGIATSVSTGGEARPEVRPAAAAGTPEIPTLDGKVIAEFGSKVEKQLQRFGGDFLKGFDIGKGGNKKIDHTPTPMPKPTDTTEATADAEPEPVTSGLDLRTLEGIAIDLNNLPPSLMFAAIGASAQPLTSSDVAVFKAASQEMASNPLAALNIKTRLLVLIDPLMAEDAVQQQVLGQIDLAMRALSVATIRQQLDDQPVHPNLASTLEAVGKSSFGNRDDAPKIRLAMRDLPGSPFCCGFLWIQPDTDGKSGSKIPARCWLVLQPDTSVDLAANLIRNLRIVGQGKVGR